MIYPRKTPNDLSARDIGTNTEISKMAMPGSTAGKSLGDQGISGVFATDRTPHEARDVVMSVVYSIDFNAAWASALVGYDFVIEILQFEILHADRSLELRLHVDGFDYSLFVVTDTEDPPREALLSCFNDAPAAVLPVQMCIDIGSVGSSLEGLPPFVITRQRRHISRVTDVDDNVRLKVVDKMSKPLSSLVVVLVMCVGVRDD